MKRAFDALAIALVTALPVAAWDALALTQPEVPFGVAFRAAVPGCAGGVAVLLPLAALLVLATRRPMARWWATMRDAPEQHGASLMYGTALALIVAVTTYGGAGLFARAFGSSTVQRLALAFTLLGIVVIAFALRRIAVQQLARWLERIPVAATTVSLLLAGVMVIAGLIALFVVGAPIIDQLDLHPYLAALGLFVGAVFAAMVARRRKPRRGVVRGTLVASVGVVALAAWSLATPRPGPLLLAVAQRATLTSWLTTQLSGSDASFAPRQLLTCDPTQAPSEVADVGRAPANAPDILLITIDALRWDHTTLAGYKRDTTPNIAREATAAVVFERAYSPASSTRQSFRSLFTGLYPSLVVASRATDQWGVSFVGEQRTLAEYLRHGGYHTVGVHTYANLFDTAAGAMDGFAVADDSPSDVRLEIGWSADHQVDLALRYLAGASAVPRFLWTHFSEPHQPYPSGPKPVSYGDDEVARYDAAIHFVDAELGRLLSAALSREQPTWVFLTADHGQAFLEHGNRFHGTTVYEEEINVPLVVWGPGVTARRERAPVSLVDVLPTLLDVAGLTPPSELCGISLRPQLNGEPAVARPVYVEQIPDHTRTYFAVAFIQGETKTILRPSFELRELYDLAGDPGEQNNKAEGEQAQMQLATLRKFYLDRGMDPVAYGL